MRLLLCSIFLLSLSTLRAQKDSLFFNKSHFAVVFEPSFGASFSFSKSHPEYEFSPYYCYGYSIKAGINTKNKLGIFTGINIENRGIKGVYSYFIRYTFWGPYNGTISYSGHTNTIGIPIALSIPVFNNLYITPTLTTSLLMYTRYTEYDDSRIDAQEAYIGSHYTYESVPLKTRAGLDFTLATSYQLFLGDHFLLNFGGQFRLYDITRFEYQTTKFSLTSPKPPLVLV